MRYEGLVPEVRSWRTADVPAQLLEEIRRMLDEAFDGDFSDDDWEHMLGGDHVVVIDQGVVVAHAAAVPRRIEVGGRPFETGYVEAVATSPSRQGQGLGSRAMTEVTALVRRRFQLGALSTDRHSFYERLGWQRWEGPTFVRSGSAVRRTPDEDDGVMVLRFGTSADLDLRLPIMCEARVGDDW
jgi:aminoglycoside 2'-N-acetyltransferase I